MTGREFLKLLLPWLRDVILLLAGFAVLLLFFVALS